MKLIDFSRRHPVVFSALSIAFFWSFGLVPVHRLFVPALHPYDAEILKDAIAQLVAAAGVIVLCRGIGLKGRMGFSAPRPWTAVLLSWPLALFAVINLPEHFPGFRALSPAFSSPRPYILTLFALSVGLIEEILCRSLVCGVLAERWGEDRSGRYRVALVSGLLFGISHIGNFFMYDYRPLASATQIVFAMFFGVFFYAIYYRTGSIIPGIIFHALIDLSANLDVLFPGADPVPPSERIFSRTPESALFAIAITVPLFLMGLFFLWRSRTGAGTVSLEKHTLRSGLERRACSPRRRRLKDRRLTRMR